jgi:hypothetical protein
MKTIRLPSGETIELTPADSHAGPGHCYSGQNVNGTGVWIRKPGERWFRCTRGERSWYATACLAELASTAAEAFDVLGAIDPTIRPPAVAPSAVPRYRCNQCGCWMPSDFNMCPSGKGGPCVPRRRAAPPLAPAPSAGVHERS